ncbi:MAG TPA: hypothetical protein VNU26_18250 [Mycobacteriales bacterium]|nr:hypothetical protein [Mycobacteriales bacterium]
MTSSVQPRMLALAQATVRSSRAVEQKFTAAWKAVVRAPRHRAQ